MYTFLSYPANKCLISLVANLIPDFSHIGKLYFKQSISPCKAAQLTLTSDLSWAEEIHFSGIIQTIYSSHIQSHTNT